MILLVTLLLLVAVLAFVGYPLVRAPEPAADDAVAPAAGQREQLLAERESAVAALKDLEFEHNIGNLSSGDYETLRAAQRYKAVAILGELERLGDAGATSTLVAEAPSIGDHLALDARLEEEIARARRRLDENSPAPPAYLPAMQLPATEPEATLRCPACGAPHAPASRFCSACGHRFGESGGERAVVAGTVTCPACGTRHAARDRFCADCGTILDGERRNGHD